MLRHHWRQKPNIENGHLSTMNEKTIKQFYYTQTERYN